MQPDSFERALQNYDPALEVRWGHIVKAWVVERRCHVSEALVATLVDGMRKAIALMHHPQLTAERRYMLQKACEEGYSAGYGKRVVVYAKALDNRVFDALRLTDLQNSGNMQRVIDASANRDAKKKHDRYEEFEPLGRETISVVDWASRKHSTAVEHGKAPQLVAEAFHKEAPPKTRQHFTRAAKPPSLLDSYGRPVAAQ